MATAPKGNHQHLTLSDRIYIEQGLERRMSFKDIAKFIAKIQPPYRKRSADIELKNLNKGLPLCVFIETRVPKPTCATIGTVVTNSVESVRNGVVRGLAGIIRPLPAID